MRDVDLIDLIATRIETALAAINHASVPVLQKHQPNQQGIPTGPSIWLYKMFDHPYGWPSVKLKYDSIQNLYVEREVQLYNSTFQISALWPQTPGDDTLPTASDVLNYLQRYLTSRASIKLWKDNEASIFKIMMATNPAFMDDQSQHEYHPNFQIVFNHELDLKSNVPAVKRVIPRIIAINENNGIGQVSQNNIVADE